MTRAGALQPEGKDDLKSLPMPELLADLNASDEGLSRVEAQKRLATYGLNEIAEKTTMRSYGATRSRGSA